MRLTLHALLTLDGVMQAPGLVDEDPSGGFTQGGWLHAFADERLSETIGGWFRRANAFLLGRVTYDLWSEYWPTVTDEDNVVARTLNESPKYVASTTLTQVSWAHTTLLGADVVGAITKLKASGEGELQVHGSTGLAQTLIDHDLVDEFRLVQFPLHLGAGKQLFREGTSPGTLRLCDSAVTTTGAVISIYVPAGSPHYGTWF